MTATPERPQGTRTVEADVRAWADANGMVLVSRKFHEAASDAIRFMVTELEQRKREAQR